MRWIDYREKLGIGFNDEQKFHVLRNKVLLFFDFLEEYDLYTIESFRQYTMMVGTRIYYGSNFFNALKTIFDGLNNIHELLAHYMAVCNTYNATRDPQNYNKIYTKKVLLDFIKNKLDGLRINYEIFEDEDGYFIFPKGAKELDDALVSQPLEWLKGYPLAHKAFIKALKDYSSATEETASEVADSLRKALETFFQEFFNSCKSLEKYKSEYGDYLKSHGIPAEITNDFNKLLDSFTNYNNNYAKHHDKSSINVLEYLLYQTGNIIRLLITLKNGEENI